MSGPYLDGLGRKRKRKVSFATPSTEENTNFFSSTPRVCNEHEPDTPKRRRITPTEAEVIPKFTPEARNSNVKGWLHKIDQLGDVYGWNNKDRQFVMQIRLRGSARDWYDDLEDYDLTWDEWKQTLQTAFPRSTDFVDRLEEMLARSKADTETMTKYFHDKLSLLKKCKIYNEDAISCIIKGLPIELRANAKAYQCETPEQLYYGYLSSLENFKRVEAGASARRSTWRRGTTTTTTHLLPKVCYVCRRPGHEARDCRTQLHCDVCQRSGHNATTCWFAAGSSRQQLSKFWSAFVPCATQNRDAVQLTLEQIDVIRRLVDKYPQYFQLATSVTDILQAHSARPRKIASLIGIEGGHSIGNSLGVLRSYYQLGVRYMTLTHTCNTPWADSSNEAPAVNGLTEFGEKVVKEMNRLGMLVDLSHVGENTTRAAIKLSKAPVIFSHSSVHSLCAHKRNVPTDIIHSLKENGGIIMVNFFPDFVKCAPNATLSDVAEHFHYIKRVIGADYVGIGGDFDGVNRVPRGLEDVSKYPELFAELLRSGQWSVQELKNLAGLNMLRVMRQVEKVRDEMRTNGVEPEEHPDSPNDNGNCTSNAFYTEYV